MSTTFHQLVIKTSQQSPENIALQRKEQRLNYRELNQQVTNAARGLLIQGLQPAERVAIYLPKQFESVIGMFATTLAGGAFVPVNPLLKAAQVGYILSDSQVSILLTSHSRYKQLQSTLSSIDSLHTIVLTDCKLQICPDNCLRWEDLIAQDNRDSDDSDSKPQPVHPKYPSVNPKEMAAILYTSGSTGQPKGVVLSHINLVEGAKSVANYLNNTAKDRLLAVLPFSFDYGLSQLTTAFLSGARVVLLEYLMPRDVVNAVARYQITGLAAVPPLWIQLAAMEWPVEAQNSLRYFTNSGGAMPKATLSQLTNALPDSDPVLMYGLTEAFRSTYLVPTEILNRPASMGKAIPNAQILVINQQGEICQSHEEGELVHKGIHVAMGYWQAEEKTAEKFRQLPANLRQDYGDEIVVWSGDRVRTDEQGFLYFIGRNDDMIKSSGYRISPAEIEELLYAEPSISEVAAIGIPHPRLGQAILLIIKPSSETQFDETQLIQYCKKHLPNYMQPHSVKLVDSLPRNPNGKINRKLLSTQYQSLLS
jgi:acyl-CoA ligase (AMP-forming) (exosortase A-associated)